MKCPKCGEEIANDSNFCEYCGERITSSVQQHFKSHSKILYAICALCIIIGFGLIVMIINSATNFNSDRNNRVIDTTESPSDSIAVVDLGLPSGTLWLSENVDGFYDYDSAVSKYGESLPTKEQWDELKDRCQWLWTGSGYEVTGPNGNSIILPAEGFRHCSGDVYDVGSAGCYWSSTPNDSEEAWEIYIGSLGAYVSTSSRCGGFSVRLVQD